MTEDHRPLAGLAIAVTRPAGQQQVLTGQLRHLGADAVSIPLLAIVPAHDPDETRRITDLLTRLPSCQHAIFISQNAAEQALLALATRDLAWPETVQAYAVGTATGDYLARHHGIVALTPTTTMNSEGLLALPSLQSISGQRVIVFRGSGGRETLADALRKRGAGVDYCELYRRCLPPEAAGQWQHWVTGLAGRKAVACINSTDTLSHLLAIDKTAATRDNLFLLVPGERVFQAARALGFCQLLMAPDALDDSMIDHLLAWYRHDE